MAALWCDNNAVLSVGDYCRVVRGWVAGGRGGGRGGGVQLSELGSSSGDLHEPEAL